MISKILGRRHLGAALLCRGHRTFGAVLQIATHKMTSPCEETPEPNSSAIYDLNGYIIDLRNRILSFLDKVEEFLDENSDCLGANSMQTVINMAGNTSSSHSLR